MLKINSKCIPRKARIGANHHCLIIDDILENPHEVISFATEHSSSFILQPRGTPGALMHVDEHKTSELKKFICELLELSEVSISDRLVLWVYLAIITLPPYKLNWAQRLPHIDPGLQGYNSYAGVIYLFHDVNLGGTGFYRLINEHLVNRVREQFDQDYDATSKALQDNFKMFREPSCYITKTCEAAELLLEVPARFNRLVFYSGAIPHSPHIFMPELLTDNIEVGRLTLNFCVNIPKNIVV